MNNIDELAEKLRKAENKILKLRMQLREAKLSETKRLPKMPGFYTDPDECGVFYLEEGGDWTDGWGNSLDADDFPEKLVRLEAVSD